MRELGRRLESGDESQLICWIKPGDLGCTVRPLRSHPDICTAEVDIAPNSATSDQWVTFVKVEQVILDYWISDLQ